MVFFFFFSSRRRHTRYWRDWSSDVCSSDLTADVRVEARERVRADAEPVERLKQRPAREGEREAAPPEAARGGDDASLGLHETSLPPERAQQVQVFKDGERLEAARALVGRAPHEDARVAVGQPQQTQPRVEPR